MHPEEIQSLKERVLIDPGPIRVALKALYDAKDMLRNTYRTHREIASLADGDWYIVADAQMYRNVEPKVRRMHGNADIRIHTFDYVLSLEGERCRGKIVVDHAVVEKEVTDVMDRLQHRLVSALADRLYRKPVPSRNLRREREDHISI